MWKTYKLIKVNFKSVVLKRYWKGNWIIISVLRSMGMLQKGISETVI
jgi:hypothetical protein